MKSTITFSMMYVGLTLLSLSIYAQQERIMTPQEMKKDITFYFKELREMHPNVYEKYTASQMDSVENQLLKQCGQSMSLFDFNYLLAKTTKYTDEFTYVECDELTSLPEEYEDQYFPPAIFSKDKITVNGINIISINDISSKKIINELDALIPWQCITYIRQKKMNELLSPVLYKVFHITPPFTCKIQVKDTQLIQDTIFNPVYSTIEATPPLPKYYTEGPLSYDYFEKDSIALLFYNQEVAKDNALKNEYIDYVTTFFNLMKGHNFKYLFIDLSQFKESSINQEEGESLFLPFLKTKPYELILNITATSAGAKKYYDQCYSQISGGKKKKELPKAIQKGIEKDYPELNMFLSLAKDGKIEYPFKGEENPGEFDGKVFIIMGKDTGSKGRILCERIKKGNAGILVGETPYVYIPASGNEFYEELPESGIKFLCTILFTDLKEKESYHKDRFLQPDIPYKLTYPLKMKDYKEIIRINREKNL